MTPTQRRAMIKAIAYVDRAKTELRKAATEITPYYPLAANMISRMVSNSVGGMGEQLKRLLEQEVSHG